VCLKEYDVLIVGAGFTGLTAAHVLAKKGYAVAVIEADSGVGGLAGTFEFSDGIRVEKYYHVWFNHDTFVDELVDELGLQGGIIRSATKTSMFFNGRHWRLSTPFDLLRFTALPLIDRIRLGFSVFRVRMIKDWRSIEHLTARDWLRSLSGQRAYEVVWEPLIRAKFSVHAANVNAVWMWKKLVLRGSSRNNRGAEELRYFKGGFGRLADQMVEAIKRVGGEIHLNQCVSRIASQGTKVTSLQTKAGTTYAGRQYILTPAFPIIADFFAGEGKDDWVQSLRRVKYLGNVCLVLRLRNSLSDTFWLNVNDPGFPFVGVIEHTNIAGPESYGDSHIAFLSRYLAVEDPVWEMADEEYCHYAMSHLQKMFPEFDKSWIIDYRVWRDAFAQPVTEPNYSKYLPTRDTPFENVIISTMAHIYPEDRGTNYAIRDAREAAAQVDEKLRRLAGHW
jgi:protoporphyrinogen oxidase